MLTVVSTQNKRQLAAVDRQLGPNSPKANLWLGQGPAMQKIEIQTRHRTRSHSSRSADFTHHAQAYCVNTTGRQTALQPPLQPACLSDVSVSYIYSLLHEFIYNNKLGFLDVGPTPTSISVYISACSSCTRSLTLTVQRVDLLAYSYNSPINLCMTGVHRTSALHQTDRRTNRLRTDGQDDVLPRYS